MREKEREREGGGWHGSLVETIKTAALRDRVTKVFAMRERVSGNQASLELRSLGTRRITVEKL